MSVGVSARPVPRSCRSALTSTHPQVLPIAPYGACSTGKVQHRPAMLGSGGQRPCAAGTSARTECQIGLRRGDEELAERVRPRPLFSRCGDPFDRRLVKSKIANVACVEPVVDLRSVRTQSARHPYSTVQCHRQRTMVIPRVFSATKGFSPLERSSPDRSAHRLSRSGGGGAGSNPAGGTVSSLKTSETSEPAGEPAGQGFLVFWGW